MNILKVATAGEALIDLIGQADGSFQPCLGGAVYNLTRAIARQEIGVLYLNPLSTDRFGRQLAAGLANEGVALAQPGAVTETTSLAVVSLTAAGHPDYAFYREQVADRAISAVQMISACSATPTLELVCTGALALAAADAEIYLPWMRTQRAAGTLVVVDANLRPSVMRDLAAYRRNVSHAVTLADVIKVSDEDLAILQVPGATPLEQARTVLAQNPNAKLLALTLGGEGASLLTRGGIALRARESQALTVVDTVGAGDCFLAGLLCALLRLEGGAARALPSLAEDICRHLLSHAIASASLCVMRRGCQPPTWKEVVARVAEHPCRFE